MSLWHIAQRARATQRKTIIELPPVTPQSLECAKRLIGGL